MQAELNPLRIKAFRFRFIDVSRSLCFDWKVGLYSKPESTEVRCAEAMTEQYGTGGAMIRADFGQIGLPEDAEQRRQS